jgi:hypothetical protein
MKLYRKIAILFHFGITVLLIGIGSIVEFTKEYYPVVKKELLSFIKERYREYNKQSYGGLPAV